MFLVINILGFQWYVPAIFNSWGEDFTNLSTTTERMGERREVVGIVITLGVYIMCHLIGWETNWMRQRDSGYYQNKKRRVW